MMVHHGKMKLVMRTIMVLAALVIPILWGRTVKADMIDTSGMKPWEVCALCHGLNGISRISKFPKLAGQKAAYIEKQLRDFRAGRRANDGGNMAAIASSELSEDNIPVVANYFAKLTAPKPQTSDEDKSLAKGRKLFEQGDAGRNVPPCQSCHVAINDAAPLAPSLTSQHPDYLAKQLHDFRDGKRTNDENQIMGDIARALSKPEIQELVAFIASRPRASGIPQPATK